MFSAGSKKFIYAIATLAGAIIGVGFFSLPYITSKVGFWVMLVYFLVVGFLVIVVHLLFSEVALKTPDYKRLPGYAEIYLKKKGKAIATASMIIGSLGTLLVYLLIGGRFLANLLSPIFGGSDLIYTIIYFIAGAVIIYAGIKPIAKIDFWSLILFFAVIYIIYFWGKPYFNINNLFPIVDKSSLFLPYGAILFSLWGATMIPEAEEMLGERKQQIKKAVFSAVLISALVYLFFIILVAGVAGPLTTPDAISGLSGLLGRKIALVGYLLGILTTFTSFIAIGLTLKKVFWYDLKIPKNLSWLLTVFPPLFLYLAGFQDFVKIISFLGGVMLGIEGVLIILMYQKIKSSKARFFTYPLVLIFVLGIIYEIIYFVK